MGCCTYVLHGTFVREQLERVGIRHNADCPRTPGLIEEISRGAWWHQGRHLKTGKVYR